jgi:hypothetical protein
MDGLRDMGNCLNDTDRETVGMILTGKLLE